jgi:membrane protein implicated in regulation of membrane protease activity
MLLLGVLAVVVVGLVALLVMVGAAVAMAGLAISAVAALYYTVRRKLSAGTKQDIWLEPEKPETTTSSLVVRDIEVEVLPQKER